MIDFEAFGEPDIRVGPLHIWVHGREREDTQDYWDANWLRVTVYCATGFSKVTASGSILHLSELSAWRKGLTALYEAKTGTAKLEATEPNLAVCVSLKDGKGSLEISLTGDHLQESHEFFVEIDQSYLPALLSDLHRLFDEYPILGNA